MLYFLFLVLLALLGMLSISQRSYTKQFMNTLLPQATTNIKPSQVVKVPLQAPTYPTFVPLSKGRWVSTLLLMSGSGRSLVERLIGYEGRPSPNASRGERTGLLYS